jgi:hypothetical protein
MDFIHTDGGCGRPERHGSKRCTWNNQYQRDSDGDYGIDAADGELTASFGEFESRCIERRVHSLTGVSLFHLLVLVFRQIECKGTVEAIGDATAMGFSDGDSQGMEFVEERGPVVSAISGEGISGELNERLVAFAVLFRGRMNELVTNRDAAEVFIRDGDGVAESVQQDCVSGFGAHSGECEQPVAKKMGVSRGETLEGSGKLRVEHGDEGLQGGSLARVETRWLDELLQLGEGEGAQAVDAERAGAAEIGQRDLDGFPGCVLSEVRADDDFEWGLRGPPELGTVGLDQFVMHGAQARGS